MCIPLVYRTHNDQIGSMLVCTKIIQHDSNCSFLWFAQVIVAVICMGIALVVCETEEKPPKEATPGHKEAPAGKDETSAETAEAPTEEVTDEECSNACEQELIVCPDRCELVTLFCQAMCKLMEYRCHVICAIP